MTNASERQLRVDVVTGLEMAREIVAHVVVILSKERLVGSVLTARTSAVVL